MYVLNTREYSRLFNMFLTLCKPFVSDRLRDNIVMHRLVSGYALLHIITPTSPSYDLASLHAEVPPVLLPSYLGGDQATAGAACVAAAKERDGHFVERIEQARPLYKG